MYDLDKTRNQLIRHEALKLSAYQDSEGYWTIGVGHLIDSRRGGKISVDTANYILDEDIAEKTADLNNHLTWWKDLDPVRQQVLLNMCFNLGIYGLLKFENTLGHIRRGEYKEASEAMLQSKWASQVGNRAVELSQMMETGI
jgi:lysozyme